MVINNDDGDGHDSDVDGKLGQTHEHRCLMAPIAVAVQRCLSRRLLAQFQAEMLPIWRHPLQSTLALLTTLLQ
jgi:hypothetical protein